jgi:hypothetical protein
MSDPARLDKQFFFDDEMVDVMLNALTGLAMELSVVRERLDTVERVLDSEGVATRDLIEAYMPDKAAHAERVEARMQLIRATLDPFKDHFARKGETVSLAETDA